MTDVITTFMLTLLITFSLFLFIVVLISYCKRRQGRTRHGLSGMCHQSGGTMCSSCRARLRSTADRSA